MNMSSGTYSAGRSGFVSFLVDICPVLGWRHQKSSSVVRIHGRRVAPSERAQILPGPHVMQLVGSRTEAGDFREIKRLGRRVAGVDDEDVRSLGRPPRVELGRRGGRRRRGGRERSRRGSDSDVLVEREQLRVRDNGELRRVQLAKLWVECRVRSVRCNCLERGGGRTSVPNRIGLLKNAHAAKCVRCS